MKRVALRRIVSKIASRRIETRRVASSVVVCHGGFKAELKLFDDYSSLPDCLQSQSSSFCAKTI